MKNYMRIDPTRTTLLRRRYVAAVRRRVGSVIQDIRKLIVDQDVFGITATTALKQNVEKQAWVFHTDPKKVEAFKAWLQERVDQKILETDAKGDPWEAEYIQSAYTQGAVRAYTDTHAEALAKKADFYEGGKEEFLRSSFGQPETKAKLQLLYTRSFNDLKGFTDQMAADTSRILTDGLANGKNPVSIARQMTKQISGLSKKRAETIARTEIINAHSEGQLDAFEDLGVEEVGVMAEWLTAGDDRVCDSCAKLEGAVMTVKEARGMIPRHPGCRCCWIPAIGPEKGQKISKSAISSAVDKSILGEGRSTDIQKAREKSTWIGKTKTFTGKYDETGQADIEKQVIEDRAEKRRATRVKIPKAEKKKIQEAKKELPPAQMHMISGWQPSMTPSDAQDWANHGKYQRNVYHVTTSAEAAAAIEKDGFKIDGKGQYVWGRGVYVSMDRAGVEFYEELNRDLKGHKTETLTGKVFIDRPFNFDADKFQSILEDRKTTPHQLLAEAAGVEKNYAKLTRQIEQHNEKVRAEASQKYKAGGAKYNEFLAKQGYVDKVEPEAITRALEAKGYDSIIIKNRNLSVEIGGDQIVVFNPHRVTVQSTTAPTTPKAPERGTVVIKEDRGGGEKLLKPVKEPEPAKIDKPENYLKDSLGLNIYMDSNAKSAQSLAQEVSRLSTLSPKALALVKDQKVLQKVIVEPESRMKARDVGSYLYTKNAKGKISGSIRIAEDKMESGPLTLGKFAVSKGFNESFRHELGHAHSYALTPEQQSEWKSIFEKQDKTFWSDNVSKYASTNAHELYAESFTAMTHKEYKPGMLPKPVEAFFQKHLFTK